MTLANNKRKGARWEQSVADYCAEHLNLNVERRRLTGTADRGDIAGIPGLVIECKDEARWNVWQWLNEAAVEAVNDTRHTRRSTIGAVWKKRPGSTDPSDGAVILHPAVFIELYTAWQTRNR